MATDAGKSSQGHDAAHPRGTAQDVLDALVEEYHALNLLSYHGTSWGAMCADLTREDIEKIRGLLADAGSTIEAFS